MPLAVYPPPPYTIGILSNDDGDVKENGKNFKLELKVVVHFLKTAKKQ